MAEDLVAWSLGEPAAVLRGGTNALTGLVSTMEVPAIMAIKGLSHRSRTYSTPGVDREALFARDRHLCAYCGQVFKEDDLTADHVIPESRGGAWSWMNLVAACAACNSRKDDRTPEEARMPLLYLPYVPSLHEHFILSGRRILADQLEYLMAGVPKHSRLHS
jgi:5-methylcytosine-specific restriction endonuclease McrA